MRLRNFGFIIRRLPNYSRLEKNMEFHECANIFPLMDSEEFNFLCTDIAENGLLEAIWTYHHRIIDGRNRYNACLQLNIEPRYREWTGNGSLVAFIVSLNLRRRHLSTSQRAIVAARLANLSEGRPAHKETASNEAVISQAEAADMLNVSRSSVQRATKVLREGVNDLAELIESGELEVSPAAHFAELPKGKQKRLLKRGTTKLVSYATNLAVKKRLKNAKHTSDVCLLCNPAIQPNQDNVLAFLYAVTPKLGSFNRYASAVIEEIEELDAMDDIHEGYGKILLAIDAGYREFAQIAKFTGLPRDILQFEIERLLDGKSIEEIAQGGKTAMARGAAKKLYQRRAVVEIYSEDFMDEVSRFEN